VTMPFYDPNLSLTENLSRNGFGHRASPIYGKREVFQIDSGGVVGWFGSRECEHWLKAWVLATSEGM